MDSKAEGTKEDFFSVIPAACPPAPRATAEGGNPEIYQGNEIKEV